MKIKSMLTATALSLVASVASAGLVQPAPVIIDFTNRVATGDMLTARNSANPFEFIGCGVRYNAAGLTLAFCQAGLGDTDAERITCFTTNPALVEAIQSIGDFSFISFRWDVDGNCTNFGVSTQSFYLPELLPDKDKSK
jgi:hypothetical protein